MSSKLKIDHNIKDFQSGNEYIMTLKDSNVLESDSESDA